MPTTLADIAKELGVSKMTVSRAINNHPAINTETRERVMAVARRMNYRPNQHARALITNRSYLIGLIVPDLMHSYFAELAMSIESVLRPAGYKILICTTQENAAAELAEVEALQHRTDGLIIASAASHQGIEVYRSMVVEGSKIVLLDRTLEGLPVPSVTINDVSVGRLATTHLINLGHRRIGHLRGPEVSTAIDRYNGYKAALADHGLAYEDDLVRASGYLESEGYRSMLAWIEDGDLPSAIFAANDPAAIGAIHALEEKGIRVPQDLAIAGAGKIHYGDMFKTPLTTVGWDLGVMGQRAAGLLLEALDPAARREPLGDDRRIVCEPNLVIRKSCGAGRLL